MQVKNKKFITDEQGRIKAVILSYSAYEKLMDYVQDLEDAVELDKMSHTEQKFQDYSRFQGELKQKGRLK